ncbi:MAG: hypothetical protein Q9190_004548 [Brigantiaea leucoxantha]
MTAVLSLTNDLRDVFYPGEQTISAILTSETTERVLKVVKWVPGSQSVQIDMDFLEVDLDWPARLHFAVSGSRTHKNLSKNNVPEFVDVWTSRFRYSENPRPKMMRVFYFADSEPLEIYEDYGNTLEGHIWYVKSLYTTLHQPLTQARDAGLVLLCSLAAIYSDGILPDLSQGVHDILEIGSGTGVVGIGMAHVNQNCDVILTDHPEKTDVLCYNTQRARTREGSNLGVMPLDWHNHSANIAQIIGPNFKKLSLVLVADCTYNTDSLPALVNTLKAIMLRLLQIDSVAELPGVWVATKIRDPREAVFSTLMIDAGFVADNHRKICLPDSYREQNGESLEVVEMCRYSIPTKQGANKRKVVQVRHKKSSHSHESGDGVKQMINDLTVDAPESRKTS